MSTPVPPPPPPDDSGPPPPPPYQYGPAPGGPPPYPDAASGMPPAPGYGPAPGFQAKPPRPDAKLAGGLMVAGAILAIVGVYLPWLSGGFIDQNGTGVFLLTDTNTGEVTSFDGPGIAVIVISVVLAGLGIALFFAGRVLAVAIIGIVVAAIAVLVGAFMIGLANSTSDFSGGDLGIGVILQPIAPLAALAGSIIATATRRR